MEKEVELRKFKDTKRKLKVTLLHDTANKCYIVQQNRFKASYKKLSAANYHFEDLIFQNFLNQLPLAELVCEGIRK